MIYCESILDSRCSQCEVSCSESVTGFAHLACASTVEAIGGRTKSFLMAIEVKWCEHHYGNCGIVLVCLGSGKSKNIVTGQRNLNCTSHAGSDE